MTKLIALALALILGGLAWGALMIRRARTELAESASELVVDLVSLLLGGGPDSILLPIFVVLAGLGLLGAQLGWF